MPSVDVTVAIPAYRRPHMLVRAIASIGGQSLDRPFEVLVVDSAGEGLRLGDLPRDDGNGRTRVIHAKHAGTAHARNTALREARGEIVAFLDEDAEAAPGWLRALSDAYAGDDAHKTVAAAGGRISPQFVQPPPRWLQEAYDLIANEYSALDHGEATLMLTYPETLYGPNFSVRRKIALACGGFREDMGPRNGHWNPGEEVELIHRLQHLGYSICWVPSAVVRHNVAKDRMTRAFLRRRAYSRGLNASLGKLTGPAATLPRDLRMSHMAAAIVYHTILSQAFWLTGRTRAAVVHDRAGARWAGILSGKVQQKLRAGRPRVTRARFL